MGTATIPVASIERDPKQPRTVFDETALAELADSLRERGQIQPITVRRKPGKGPACYIVVTGERRWRAAQLAGLASLTAVVVAPKKDRLIDQIAENLQRAEMSPLETARAYRRAIDDLGISASELAKRLGLRQPFRIQESLSLLKLCDKAQYLLDQGLLSRTCAWQLTALQAEQQEVVLRQFEAGKLTTDGLFVAACNAARRPADTVEAKPLFDVDRQGASLRRLLQSVQAAGAELGLLLQDQALAGLGTSDVRLASDQLKMLLKTTRELKKVVEQNAYIDS